MKQGLLVLFITGMVCMTQDLTVVPFTLMRFFPQTFGTSHCHSSWNECIRLVCFQSGHSWLGALGGGMLLISLLKGNPPHIRIYHLGALLFPQLFLLLLQVPCCFYICFPHPPKSYFQTFLFFKNEFCYSLLSPGLMYLAQSRCVQQSWSTGPARGGCWLPSPDQSSRQPCSWIPADSLSQTADAKIGKKYN